MMIVDKDKVKNTAEILKFKIEDKQIQAIVDQANDMISIIDAIQVIDTENNEKTNLMSLETNVFAKYDQEEEFYGMQSYNNFDGEFFEIKKVIGDE